MGNQDTENPLDHSTAHDERIRLRAYMLWEQDGCPDGQDLHYWERARALDALATYAPAPLPETKANEPLIEQAALQENLGEFPAHFTDQGERMPTPASREIAKKFRDGER